MRPELEASEPKLVLYLPDEDIGRLVLRRQPAVPPSALRPLIELLRAAITWDPHSRCAPVAALDWIGKHEQALVGV